MSQEQRDSYVIPPNFIEGGSFFGGLFKARNVVEAVILAAGTGLPILTLSLTLTVRIILLCLTSLPLALLALIGIAGMPLSSYIILFFRFLRNRRSLSQSGGRSSRKQAILPTWDKKSGPSTAVQPAAYKKDGSHIRFAKDTRRLMLDTAYRQKKQTERPGNPLAAYVPIQEIESGIVYTTDHRFIKILEIVPINFLLRSAREQRNIVYSFISYLKIAPVKLQIKVITKRADMNRHIETVRREMAQETNESCRMQQEDYLKLLKKLGSKEAIARRFFLIMEYEPLPGAKKDREEADAISSLQTAARTAANYLRQCGNSVVQHENEDEAAAEMLYTFLCRRESTDIPFLQRISHITSNYIKSGCSIDEIPVGDFFAPSQLDFMHGSYEDERINNVNLFISQYCAYRDTDVAAISLEDMKQLLRSGIGELYDYTYEDETREIEETVLNEDGEEVTELREVTVRVYTLTYRGEAYFADSIFHLTAEQKTLAQNFAENLSLFLGDGLFQNLSSSESSFTIPALGNIRYTDGGTEVVYYNQLDERYANKPYGTDNIGGYGCGPTAMAMVVSSLTDDLVDPVEMAKWSYEHGYWCSGSGSYHALIPAAAEAWGLPVSGCTASEPQRITDALSSGKLVVAIMSAGHFTSSGHFIVLRGVKDEKILVADPASRTRSEQSWELSIILNEASKSAGSGGPFWIIG